MLRPICLYILFVLFLVTVSDGFSQQLKLGKNPSAVIKSAVLELESSNQGLLFPRLADTAGINLFSPPDGMVIYLTSTKQLYVRSNGRWSVLTSGTIDTTNISNFYLKSRGLLSAGTGISYNNVTGVITNSAPDQTVALTAGSGIGVAGTYPNFTITNNSPSSGGTVTSVTSANANATITNTTTTPVITIVSAPKLTTPKNIQGVAFDGSADINPINGTGLVRASGTTITYDNNTYLTSIDTTNIANFYTKVRTRLSAGTGITYNNFTGVITNSAPDQTVALTAGTGISVTGTYPNFTVTNTSTSSGGTVTSVTSANGNATITNTTTTPVITIVSAPKLTTPKNIQGVAFDGTVDINPINGTGLVRANGTTLSYDNSTYLTSIDTTNIANFGYKVRTRLSATAPVAYNNTTGVISMAQASGSTDGYLSSTDWNTFNSKGGGSVTSVSVTTANGVSGAVTNPTTTPAISLTLGAITPTSVAATGTVTGSNLSGTNTGNVTLGTANGLSLTGQALSLGLASTSTAGALSSTDWNTFNNKLSSNNVWTRQGNAGTNPGTDFIGTTDAQDLIFKTNGTERWRIENSSGDIKIGSSTSGTFKATQELVMRQDGDTYGSSILRLRNRNGENGAIFETTDPTTTLVDFIFKTATSQRNIRYEGRNTSPYNLVGIPAFHIGGSNPDLPNLAIGDNYSAFSNKLKIGSYATATEVLDVVGNVKFSGALMPNNTAGTSGQVLQSNGTGAAPTWVTPTSSPTSDDYVYSYATATKTFTTAGTWADITINGANGPLSGWTHSTSSNTQNFTCNQTGVYQVSYSAQVVNTNSTVRELAIRAVLDGTEIAGSANSTECSTTSNTSLNNTFLVSITSGQVLKLQMTGSNPTIQLVAGGYGTTKPSISITIIRIK